MRVKRLLTFAKVDDARQTYPDLQFAFVTSHRNLCLASSIFRVLSLRNLRKQKSLENTEESNLIHLALQLAIVTYQGNLCR